MSSSPGPSATFRWYVVIALALCNAVAGADRAALLPLLKSKTTNGAVSGSSSRA
jgi:hypothetical protein